MINKEALLEAYRTYDYLNEDAVRPLIKIFVSYIKPSFLFKSEILTPIHLGRAVETANSKDGVVSESDLQWLHQNCIGDDDVGGSLSSVNRRIGFFSGSYWAWKNYARLGDPEYFGSFGYRKLLAPSCLSRIPDCDAILPKAQYFKEPLRTQFRKSHGDIAYEMLMNVATSCFSDKEKYYFEKYLGQSSGYFHELYILRKELFFEFCEWMYAKLMFLLRQYPVAATLLPSEVINPLVRNFLGDEVVRPLEIAIYNKKKSDVRDMAFLLERLTGFFLYSRIVIPHSRRYVEADVLNYADEKRPLNVAIMAKLRATARGMVCHRHNERGG